jgi:predicted lipid-binding transport protein (Tim44 family)
MKDLIVSKPSQPQPSQPNQQIQQPQPQQKPTLASSIIDGMAFGGGSGLAHAFIGRLFSSNQSKAEDKKTQYTHCLEITKNNYEACEHLQM